MFPGRRKNSLFLGKLFIDDCVRPSSGMEFYPGFITKGAARPLRNYFHVNMLLDSLKAKNTGLRLRRTVVLILAPVGCWACLDMSLNHFDDSGIIHTASLYQVDASRLNVPHVNLRS